MANLFRRLFAGNGSRRAKPEPAAPAPNQDTFQILAENSLDLMLKVGPDMRVRYASRSAKELFGYEPEELVGGGPGDFIAPEDLPEVGAVIARILSGEIDTVKTTCRFIRKDRSVTWIEASARMLRDPVTGGPGEMVVAIRDISDRKALEEKLSEQALTDSLTGLLNRRAFDEALDREWRRTLREAGELSLLLLDLDHFKEFNDRYGHQAGDDCLRAVASAMKAEARRPTDLVARYGGEEIAVILSDTGTAGATDVAERMRTAIERLRLTHAGNPEGGFRVTASVGAATAFARAGGTNSMPQGLLMAADTALYKAKRNGRNAVASTVLLAPDESGSSQQSSAA